MTQLKIALTKGRLADSAIQLLEKAGIDCEVLQAKNRKLIFDSQTQPLRFILAKAPDVTTYVKHGVVDLGIVGKDILLEQARSHYEMLDLKIGKCQFCLAAVRPFAAEHYRRKVIATKYPNVARNYFNNQGEDVEIIKIEGSVELAPILELADAIVDIVETGETLRDNGLIILDTICPISARLIVNKAALKQNKQQIASFIHRLEVAIEEEIQ